MEQQGQGNGKDGGRVELTARNLTVAYGKEVALRGAHFSLRGKVIAVIGHNGSGKSTLIKTILGLLAPREGGVEAAWIGPCGERTPLVPEEHMAFSPENGAVFSDMTVESYIKLWCRIKQRSSSYYRREGAEYLEKLDVVPLLTKLGRELSKGQRRRVQSAVGFLCRPKLFLFDEPFDGLDIVQSNHLTGIMLEEAARMAIVVSSHRMEVVERIADLIVVLESGRVVTYGSVEEVCSMLCGHSVVITSERGGSGRPVSELVPLLREQFYSCFVSHIGSEVSITGAEINLETLRQFFVDQQLEDMRVKFVRPSLVDAMHYHLKKVH